MHRNLQNFQRKIAHNFRRNNMRIILEEIEQNFKRRSQKKYELNFRKKIHNDQMEFQKKNTLNLRKIMHRILKARLCTKY